jgi:hypothetical protein
MSVVKTGIQNCELINNFVAGVEVVGEGAEDGGKDHAEGRENKVELDLRDAGLCSPLLRGAEPSDG